MEQGHENKLLPPEIARYIFPHEEVVSIQKVPDSTPQRPPSVLRELYRLAQYKMRGKVKAFAPPFASLSFDSIQNGQDTENLHLYEALFGRDSLRVAIDTMPLYPELARVTLLELARYQGITYDTEREEEPGRIPHEIRDPDDLIAQKLTRERGWHWPYYGSVDATPEYIRTLATYCLQTKEGNAFLFQPYEDREGKPRIIADSLVAAVDWILGRISQNQEGLLEFKSPLPHGLINQAWKDSPDAYFHHDGQLANHSRGIASVEVQRVVYDALLDAAEIYRNVLQKESQAEQLVSVASDIKKAILAYMWCDDKNGYFTLGTDRDENGKPRQLKIRTSNMGHLLHSRLFSEHDKHEKTFVEAIIAHLFSPEMLNVSGIRTLASDEVRFRPGAYHNGSVWLWDTHLITKGLRHHGYHHLSRILSERLFAIIDTTHKFPEFVRGDEAAVPSINTYVVDVWDSVNKFTNRIEQPPQEIQAWSVAAIVALKHYASKQQELPEPKDAFEKRVLENLKQY